MRRALQLIRGRLADAAREERGITIVEGVVAALLLVVGALAVLQTFDASARNNYRAEESQVVVNRLQAELEKIKQLPYNQIALTSMPTRVGDSNNPRWRVQGGEYAIGDDGTQLEPMVVNGGALARGGTISGGVVAPGPTPFTAGDVSGKIYRFIVWRDDPSCGGYCPFAQDVKRIIVAATVDEAGVSFERAFQEVQTEVYDPETTPVDNPAPPTEEPTDGYSAEFWLTDTACSEADRQPITADHPTHNTRATCAEGLQTGNTRGAPDIMYTEAPAIDPNYPSNAQPLYDYANDSEPATNGDQDKGLLMPWSSADSCQVEPVLGLSAVRQAAEGTLAPLSAIPGSFDGVLNLTQSDDNKHLRTHTWLSPKVTTSGGRLTGKGTLELWSKTVNGASHPGKVCFTIFVRREVEVPVQPPGFSSPFTVPLEVDLPVINTAGNLTYFEYSRASWPRSWSEVQAQLNFTGVDSTGTTAPVIIPEGSQLGMMLMVKKTGTSPGNGLEFMYDHPNFDSRLQFESNQIIGF